MQGWSRSALKLLSGLLAVSTAHSHDLLSSQKLLSGRIDHGGQHVCQVVMEDAEFQRSAADIALLLSESHVKGVWEERLPLDWVAATSLGCVAQLLPTARSRPMTEGFALTDLQVCL